MKLKWLVAVGLSVFPQFAFAQVAPSGCQLNLYQTPICPGQRVAVQEQPLIGIGNTLIGVVTGFAMDRGIQVALVQWTDLGGTRAIHFNTERVALNRVMALEPTGCALGQRICAGDLVQGTSTGSIFDVVEVYQGGLLYLQMVEPRGGSTFNVGAMVPSRIGNVVFYQRRPPVVVQPPRPPRPPVGGAGPGPVPGEAIDCSRLHDSECRVGLACALIPSRRYPGHMQSTCPAERGWRCNDVVARGISRVLGCPFRDGAVGTPPPPRRPR